jgi:hypothetical protein
VNIAGYKITNNLSNPSLFTFPQVSSQTTMAPGSFKILWADQNTTQGALHMNFTLNETSGGTIGLYAQDGETLIDQINYPALLPGTTFGRFLDGNSNWKLLFYPTPGAPNSDSIPDVGFKSGLETFDGQYSIFPNPTSDLVQVIKLGEKNVQETSIEILDVHGRIVNAKTSEIQPNKHWNIQSSNLSPGIYMLRISTSNQHSLIRFVKQ